MERLLDHVADPSGRAGYEHTEGKRLNALSRQLVAFQRVAHLRSVPVNDGNAPFLGRQLHHGLERFAGVTELIGDRHTLAGRRQRISTQRNDNGPCGRSHNASER